MCQCWDLVSLQNCCPKLWQKTIYALILWFKEVDLAAKWLHWKEVSRNWPFAEQLFTFSFFIFQCVCIPFTLTIEQLQYHNKYMVSMKRKAVQCAYIICLRETEGTIYCYDLFLFGMDAQRMTSKGKFILTQTSPFKLSGIMYFGVKSKWITNKKAILCL